MGKGKGYRVEAFGGNRQMVAAAATVNAEKNTIHLITEADITAPRRLIAEHRAAHRREVVAHGLCRGLSGPHV